MRVCKNCGSDEIGTVETITGYARGRILEDGSIDHEGYTDVDWDSSKTVGHYCGNCENQELGEGSLERLTTVLAEERLAREQDEYDRRWDAKRWDQGDLEDADS